MRFYQVTARYVQMSEDGWSRSGGIPTFYLRDDMQMIANEEDAECIARGMLSTLMPGATFHIGIGTSADFDPAIIGA